METLIESNLDSIVEERVKNIEGWGIDANPDNDPTAPMRHRILNSEQSLNYVRPPQQLTNTEILHSNERPGFTSVFGTSSPPSGLSGKLRRYAFKFSEGSSAHWLTLMLADRVNVVEGIVDDLRNGHFPNLIKERGLMAEWKYNRAATIKKIATVVAVTAAIISVMIYIRKNKKLKSA